MKCSPPELLSETPAAFNLQANAVPLRTDLMTLTKVRLTSLVLLTTLAGFYLASPSPLNGWLLFHTLLGTALVAGAAAALNQCFERKSDAQMPRTANRPLAQGRLAHDEVVVLSTSGAIIGILYLLSMTHVLAGILAAATIWIYLFLYTPLKKKTSLNTLVGAVPGALPPVIGWAAVRGTWDMEASLLFGILFFWQLPHFLAIAWLYRRDYEQGGLVMTPLHDPRGIRTSNESLLYSLILLPLSVAPYFLGYEGPFYLIGTLILSSLYITTAWGFRCCPSNAQARKLFLASLIYLPFLLGLMAWDKIGS